MSQEFSIDFDPAIIMANPSKVYQMISLLPDEMIKYELETQGCKSDNSLNKRRSQLTNIINEGKYVRGRQPVAMSAEKDLSICNGYVQAWGRDIVKIGESPEAIRQYQIRFSFLGRRIVDMSIPIKEQKSLAEIKNLKALLSLIQNQLKEITVNSLDEPLIPVSSILDNATLYFLSGFICSAESEVEVVISYHLPTYESIKYDNEEKASGSNERDEMTSQKQMIKSWNLKLDMNMEFSVIREMFIQIEQLGLMHGICKKDLLKNVEVFFSGHLETLMKDWRRKGELTSWAGFKLKLLMRFEKELDDAFVWKAIRNNAWNVNEPIREYFHRLETLLSLLKIKPDQSILTFLAMRGMPMWLRVRLRSESFQELEDLKEFTYRYLKSDGTETYQVLPGHPLNAAVVVQNLINQVQPTIPNREDCVHYQFLPASCARDIFLITCMICVSYLWLSSSH